MWVGVHFLFKKTLQRTIKIEKVSQLSVDLCSLLVEFLDIYSLGYLHPLRLTV